MLGLMSRAVTPSLEYEYEEFRNRPDPFGMADELAQARTLLVEFRESVEAMSQEKITFFIGGVANTVAEVVMDVVGHALGIPKEDRHTNSNLQRLCESIRRRLVDPIAFLYEEVFGQVSRITSDQAKTMTIILKTIGDLADKFKRMSDGVTLKVNYDRETLDMMAKFLAICVLPYCSGEQKGIIALQAERFLPGMLEADPAQVVEHG